MKHILNNLSEEEKNSIREQHTGGMKVMIENFSKLTNSKLGDSKPLVAEQVATKPSSNIVPCSKLGIKSLGYCDTASKRPIDYCAGLGVKSPGYCFIDTKQPVSQSKPKVAPVNFDNSQAPEGGM